MVYDLARLITSGGRHISRPTHISIANRRDRREMAEASLALLSEEKATMNTPGSAPRPARRTMLR